MLNEMKPILRAACGALRCELSLSSAASAQEVEGGARIERCAGSRRKPLDTVREATAEMGRWPSESTGPPHGLNPRGDVWPCHRRLSDGRPRCLGRESDGVGRSHGTGAWRVSRPTQKRALERKHSNERKP